MAPPNAGPTSPPSLRQYGTDLAPANLRKQLPPHLVLRLTLRNLTEAERYPGSGEDLALGRQTEPCVLGTSRCKTWQFERCVACDEAAQHLTW